MYTSITQYLIYYYYITTITTLSSTTIDQYITINSTITTII